jgi:2,4-dienoyl-CoA reductase-like NADH-dependent reductase (Old Yellow Enzyme family)
LAPQLFTPVELGPVRLPNQIVVSPMCQYSAHDGCADPDWHLQHLTQLGYSGAGLVLTEATAVEPIGRISHGDLGLYDDATEAALGRVLAAARRFAMPGTRFGVQLAHAGRKGSTEVPWEGGGPLEPAQDPWTTVAPSAIPFAPDWHTPEALDEAGIARIRDAFVASARRAARLGLDVIELHAAHGYLLHEFCSPLANRRTDRYGGSCDDRMRFPLEILEAVRAEVPRTTAVGLRITGTDWTDDGWTVEDAAALAAAAKELGAAYVCVSSGGIVPHIRIPVGPGYQVPLAARVREETGINTWAVGMIVTPEQAESIVAEGKADLVAIARGFLDDPRWGWHAAERLGAEIHFPPQYARSGAKVWPGAKLARPVEGVAG